MNDAKRSANDVMRFHAGYKVNEQTGCWEWQKNIQQNGYGHIKMSGKAQGAHRVSYELHKGSITNGAYVLHTCDVRCCVNPTHLFLGSAMDNSIDKKGKKRHAHGERVNTSKLTELQVLEMYPLFESGIGSPTVAKKYGIATSMAWNIKTGKSWAHLYFARYGRNEPV